MNLHHLYSNTLTRLENDTFIGTKIIIIPVSDHQTVLSCKLVQLDYFTPSVFKLWRIPPHPQPSIKSSLLPLRYGGASYSSPGRKPESVGGQNSLLHPLSFLLLPPSKGGGRGRDILRLLDAMIHSVSFQKTHTNNWWDFDWSPVQMFINICSSKQHI